MGNENEVGLIDRRFAIRQILLSHVARSIRWKKSAERRRERDAYDAEKYERLASDR
jgi:hypothetical protein